MLRLKRASAGSGKTYQLAKTFIKLLLTRKLPGKKRQLRSSDELPEALHSIMAVTFTVKATAEMKQRIVEKLAALASADKKSGEDLKKIDYLEEFISDLKVSKDEIAYLAKDALRTLLLHFSDFKVQTIDSFFQSILHTFTYEASLDENFNMEIDSDYVSSLGLDAALDSIISTDRKDSDPETLFWLRKLMGKGKASSRWNVFAKKEGTKSLYSDLIKKAKNLDKEDFQIKRLKIEEYFNNLEQPFHKIIEEVHHANLAPWIELHEARKKAAEELVQELGRYHMDISDFPYAKETSTRLQESLADFELNEVNKIKAPRCAKDISGDKFLGPEGRKKFKSVKARHPEVNDTHLNDMRSAFQEWYDASRNYLDATLDDELMRPLRTWIAYLEMIPSLMIVLEISNKKRDYLEATNTLEISDTTHILSRIIGEDETPFVYERMGARLRHYLIDEFQDTSHMQWKNLRPLLKDSDSLGEENLIIGDAKQSIYRFRNADYKLISNVVEKEFDEVVEYTTDLPPVDKARENTNFRSSAKVVKFNNHVFSNILELTKSDGQDFFSPDIKKIYEGASQYIPGKKLEANRGFVDIIVYPSLGSDTKSEAESIGQLSLAEPGFRDVVGRILELKARGYDYKDIGILVKTHNEGKAVVKMISEYNTLHAADQIPVISEENLLVASSLSVKIIIHALEVAVKGLQNKIAENPVLKEPVNEEELFDLLSSLQSQALISVIEAVLDKFVPPAQRDADAPFIATFQDSVIDYCSSHTSDIGSFLKWWKRKSASLVINTPQDSDGVKIETIHRAKGLEYKCVIMPLVNISFQPDDYHSEWKWVEPASCVARRDLLPPYLPVASKSSLLKTAHNDVYEAYCEEVALDNLNKLYVGFTRAVNELYAYCPLKSKVETTTGASLATLLQDGVIASASGEEPVEIVSPAPGLEEGSTEFRFGTPFTPEEIKSERKTEGKESELLTSYHVCADRRLLQFQDGNPLVQIENTTDNDEDEDLDPRTEGNIKHRIMQLINVAEDLDKAIRTVKTSGLATAETLSVWKTEIEEALEKVSAYGWFDPEVRVLNERTILRKGEKYHRPDRIIIRGNDTAEIIDYKFGVRRPKYRKQVREYCDLLVATGRFRSVKGYIWYVPSGEIDEV